MSKIIRAAAATTAAIVTAALAIITRPPAAPVDVVTSVNTVQTTATPAEHWVIWSDGPEGDRRRDGGTEHYVICVLASVPDGPLAEYLVDEIEAYPVPDPLTDRTRFSEGEPCPFGRLRS
jgi:hypothetical protein